MSHPSRIDPRAAALDGASAAPGPASLWRHVPLAVTSVGLIACAWPTALPRAAWAWQVPVLALPVVAVLLMSSAWADRRATRMARALHLAAVLAAGALALFLVTWQTRHAVAVPRLFPRWWVFILVLALWLALAAAAWPWGRLLALATAQTLLFVATIEPAFGLHPWWSVAAGLSLLAGWGVVEQGAGRRCDRRLLAAWLAGAVALAAGALLTFPWLAPGLMRLRGALGLRPSVLVGTRLEQAGPGTGWLLEDQRAAGGILGTAAGDRASGHAGGGGGAETSSTPGHVGPALVSGGAGGTAAAAQAVSVADYTPWQVRLDDPPIDPQDRTPLATVRLWRSWAGRVTRPIADIELRLWKAGALDSFDGVKWEQAAVGGEAIAGESGICFLGSARAIRSDRALGQEVLIHREEIGGLPFVGRPIAVGGPLAWLLQDAGGALVPDGALATGQHFRVISTPHGEPGAGRAAPDASHSEVPSLPGLLRLARDLGAPAAGRDPVAYLERVLADLRQRCEYAVSGSLPGPGDPVEGFLFGVRRGSCEHFATAFALLARAAGIPARLAVGFLAPAGELVESRPVTLTRAERHAWVEVWLADRGWLPVDPSPGGSAGVGRAPAPVGLPARWPRWAVPLVASLVAALLLVLQVWIRRRAVAAPRRASDPLQVVVRLPTRPPRASATPASAATSDRDRRVGAVHRRVLTAIRGSEAPRPAAAPALPGLPAPRGDPPWERLRDRVARSRPALLLPLLAYERAWRRALFGPELPGSMADLAVRADALLAGVRAARRQPASLEPRGQRA